MNAFYSLWTTIKLLITLLMIYWKVGKGETEEEKRERENETEEKKEREKIIMLAC